MIIKSKLYNYKLKFIDKINFNKKEEDENIYIIDNYINKKIKIKSKKKIVINSVENSKDFKELNNIIKKLLDLNISRNNKIICIGGGITQDVSSFVASIIFRGIDWEFYPTTIISQCDSCIGGKTSINFQGYKNLIGNFYPPKKIFININFLKTLSKSEIFSGMGEMAHYFFLSKENYNLFFDNLDNIVLLKHKILKKILAQNLKIKKKFIEQDEFDNGKRLLLNFGHTFGHAIEKTTNFDCPHGLAVAHGIDMALFFSNYLGLLSNFKYEKMRRDIVKISSFYRLKKINIDKFIKNFSKDKKHSNNYYKVILTSGVGKMFIFKMPKNKSFKIILKKYFDRHVN